jgi:dTDP-4-amino-4,6-dideoxygalactose transaminase
MHSKVAVPMFVCHSLTNAVIQEHFQPCYFDLKKNSYWTNYDLNSISIEQCSVIILVHLYGFLHPDTKTIEEYCRQKNVFLIHDMAQCFGINESELSYGSIMYSFGPGKSSTAAGGGLIKEINIDFYKIEVTEPSIWLNYKAKILLKSRIYGYRFSLVEKMVQKFVDKIPTSNLIQSMSTVQKDAAEYIMSHINEICEERSKRYGILADAVATCNSLSVPYDDDGLYFKIVLYVKGEVNRFKEYLKRNKVPFYCLYDSIKNDLPINVNSTCFENNAPGFIELSTEASIPTEEITRIGEILRKYN